MIEQTNSPLVVCNDCAFIKFVKGEERCLKFINQDLIFLQASKIPSTFSNISHESAKVKEPTSITLPTHISTESSNILPTQTVEPVLGFTPVEIHRVQAEPKLTVQKLLEIESCKDYVKIPFLKEQVASQWAGLPPEKLLQESFIEQLNSIQSLNQLAPLTTAKEHLPKDIINILELLGKADNTPFNQLYNLAEDCVDRYYTKVIKLLHII